jgi:hypothetical protein
MISNQDLRHIIRKTAQLALHLPSSGLRGSLDGVLHVVVYAAQMQVRDANGTKSSGLLQKSAHMRHGCHQKSHPGNVCRHILSRNITLEHVKKNVYLCLRNLLILRLVYSDIVPVQFAGQPGNSLKYLLFRPNSSRMTYPCSFDMTSTCICTVC